MVKGKVLVKDRGKLDNEAIAATSRKALGPNDGRLALILFAS